MTVVLAISLIAMTFGVGAAAAQTEVVEEKTETEEQSVQTFDEDQEIVESEEVITGTTGELPVDSLEPDDAVDIDDEILEPDDIAGSPFE